MLDDVQGAIAGLKRLEQLILGGAEVGGGVFEQIRVVSAHVNIEVERLEKIRREEAKEREESAVSEKPAAPVPALATVRTQRKSSRKKSVAPPKRSQNDRSPTPPRKSRAPPKERAEDGEEPVKKKKKAVALSLFSLAKTPKGAIVLYDPDKVKKRGREAELVTTPVAKKKNVTVKKADLEGLSFGELSEEQQHAVTDRLCSEVIAIAQANFRCVVDGGAGDEVVSLLRAGGANAPEVSKRLYRRGGLLQMLARHSAILAGYREHERLAAQEGGVTTKRYHEALEGVAESYGVDYTVQSLRRYHIVGGLFARCPVLMLCDWLTTFKDQHLIFEKMLDQDALMVRLNGIAQLEDGGPIVELLENAGNGEEEQQEDAPKRSGKRGGGSCAHLNLQCYECHTEFCPVCSGGHGDAVCRFDPHGLEYAYPKGPNEPIVPLPLYVYCKPCLQSLDFQVGDTLRAKMDFLDSQFLEVARLREIFTVPDCAFEWIPVRADGSCVVLSVCVLLELRVWDFCKDLAAFTADWALRNENGVFFTPDFGEDMHADKRAEFLDTWKSVARCRSEKSALNRIIATWNSSGGDLVLKMIGDYLFEKCDGKQLRVYCVDANSVDASEANVPRLRLAGSYPGEKMCDGSVDVVRWNPVLPHFDALRRKQ